MNEPNLYVVAAPSGGGKTSLISALLERDDRIRLSVSHTTRPPRPGEKNGVHYHFVDEFDFISLIRENAFLEHARVFDNRYGTGRKAVERQLADGFDVILDIDWQGARQIRKTFPSCCTIFIVPPSLDDLRQRLEKRRKFPTGTSSTSSSSMTISTWPSLTCTRSFVQASRSEPLTKKSALK